MSITENQTEWINATIARYCKDTGDLPRSTSHMSTLEQWLMRQLWEIEKANDKTALPIRRMTEYEFNQFDGWVNRISRKNATQRKGQVVFNALMKHRQELGDYIRGTRLDPFFDDTVIPELLLWLKGEIE